MKIYSNSSSTISVWANKSSYLVEYLTMILIAIGVVGITAGSHSIGLPLYKLNPMHWVIYFVILFRKPSISSIIVLAIALPLTSNMLTGHPIAIKSLIMGFELVVYGLIFISLIKYFNLAPIFAYLISQFSGHIAYYGLKYIFIKADLIDSLLISTSIILQFVIFV
jgi:hypothetical protein